MTEKLDVSKALEKLRGSDESKSRMTLLDEKTKALQEETRRLRAERLRLERNNPTDAARRDSTRRGQSLLNSAAILTQALAIAWNISLAMCNCGVAASRDLGPIVRLLSRCCQALGLSKFGHSAV